MSNHSRHDWHKQCAAKMKRADREGQLLYAQEMLSSCSLNESEMLILLERKFFLSRRPAEAILDQVKYPTLG